MSQNNVDLTHLPLSVIFSSKKYLILVISMTGERYAFIVQNHIIPSLDQKHLLERNFFMQDGAPLHIASRVKILLRTLFGNDWVLSRPFTHLCPPRSLSLSLYDFWLFGSLIVLGYIKSQVFRDRSITIEILKDNIQRQFRAISTHILRSVVHNFVSRLPLLLRNDSGNAENFF